MNSQLDEFAAHFKAQVAVSPVADLLASASNWSTEEWGGEDWRRVAVKLTDPAQSEQATDLLWTAEIDFSAGEGQVIYAADVFYQAPNAASGTVVPHNGALPTYLAYHIHPGWKIGGHSLTEVTEQQVISTVLSDLQFVLASDGLEKLRSLCRSYHFADAPKEWPIYQENPLKEDKNA